LAQFRGADSGFLSGRTAADDNQVVGIVVVCRGQGLLQTGLAASVETNTSGHAVEGGSQQEEARIHRVFTSGRQQALWPRAARLFTHCDILLSLPKQFSSRCSQPAPTRKENFSLCHPQPFPPQSISHVKTSSASSKS